MSCEAVNAYLARESNRITGDIARRGRISSPWVAMLEKDFFPDEMGYTVSRVVYQRTIPTGGAWTPVIPSGTPLGEGEEPNPSSACKPTAALLQSRQVIKTASLSEFVVDSDPICISDARSGYRFRDQIREIKNNFEKNVIDLWEDRNRSQYVAALPDANKLVFTGGALNPGTGGDFDSSPAPDSQIHQDALDYVRWKMVHDGAGEEGAYGQIDGQPIFTVIMSSEQQRALIKGNPDVRQDYRWAEPKALLKPFGVKRVYSGFYHVIDDKAPRWNIGEGGAWEAVPFYIANGSGIAVVNPAYDAALYEDVIVYHPKVTKCLMQKPLASLGGGTTFRAWDYSGEIQWVNEYDKECNKYRDNGFWSARLRAAYQDLIPEYGYAIRVLRCPEALGTTPCPTQA